MPWSGSLRSPPSPAPTTELRERDPAALRRSAGDVERDPAAGDGRGDRPANRGGETGARGPDHGGFPSIGRCRGGGHGGGRAAARVREADVRTPADERTRRIPRRHGRVRLSAETTRDLDGECIERTDHRGDPGAEPPASGAAPLRWPTTSASRQRG